MHVDDSSGLVARIEKWVPVSVGIVDARQAEVWWNLREAHGSTSARRVATNLCSSSHGIPQRDNGERNETST